MPVIKKKKKSMLFRKWSPKDDLAIGPLGNLEPTHEKEIILPQIMVVPMLMFDREFFRLGYGGGYYDKTIIKLKKHFQKQNLFFITVGLAYSAQEINKLPREKHDMNLDYIVTENNVFLKHNKIIFKRRNQ